LSELRLQDSTVLLTGATGGIGRAIARALHGRGARIVMTGRRGDVLRDLERELGDRVEIVEADLCDRSEVARLAERDVHVLVANAALPATGRLDGFSPEEIDRALDVNLRAPLQLTRALVPKLAARGSGHVVLISSLSGKVATAHSSVYCATKFGLRGFGYALHEELLDAGVGVTTIFPGFIREAGMFADSGAKLAPGIGTSSPTDVANAVLKAIETNKAEIDVAPLPMRSGVRIFAFAPSIGTRISRALGGNKIAAAVAAGQRDKR
jgi:short-subunit dehydrogenase